MSALKNHQIIISQWLMQIGKERQVPLRLNDDGHCVLQCLDDLRCVIEVPATIEPETVYMYMPLLALPESITPRLELMGKALEMNLFGLLTGGNHIGLDMRTDQIVVSYRSAVATLNETCFQQALNDMLEIGPFLKRQLLNGHDSAYRHTDPLHQFNTPSKRLSNKTVTSKG